jgi:hypothetical protein
MDSGETSSINFIFAGISGLIIIYFGIFNAQDLNYPIHSLCRGDCLSTGLQRAFSELLRGRIYEALQYNTYSVQLFLFFIEFLLQRIIILSILKHYVLLRILWFDVSITIILFLIAFYPFIENLIFLVEKLV